MDNDQNWKLEWKNFKKRPPGYVSPDFCHDPMVKGAIIKCVGHRLRINSSKKQKFVESVEETAMALNILGYNYQEAKKELLKLKNEDPLELITERKLL